MEYIDRNISIVTQGSFNNFCDVYKRLPTDKDKEEIKALTRLKLQVMRELDGKDPVKEEKPFLNDIIKERVISKKLANGELISTGHEEIKYSDIPF